MRSTKCTFFSSTLLAVIVFFCWALPALAILPDVKFKGSVESISFAEGTTTLEVFVEEVMEGPVDEGITVTVTHYGRTKCFDLGNAPLPSLEKDDLVEVFGIGAPSDSVKEVTLDCKPYYVKKNSGVDATKPDLIVTEIVWDPDKPTMNQSVTISVTVKNDGQVNNSEDSKLGLRIGDKDLNYQNVAGLNVGQSRTKKFTWQFTSCGTFQIIVTVDILGQVSEGSVGEKNNIVKREIIVECPVTTKFLADVVSDNRFLDNEVWIVQVTQVLAGPGMKGKIPVTTRRFDCAGSSQIANNLGAGSKVLVFGRVVEDGSVEVCSFSEYYLKLLSNPNMEPLSDFIWSPSRPVAGKPIKFKDNSTDPDGSIKSREWHFDDRQNGISKSKNPTYTFNEPGSYTVCLYVRDNRTVQNFEQYPCKDIEVVEPIAIVKGKVTYRNPKSEALSHIPAGGLQVQVIDNKTKRAFKSLSGSDFTNLDGTFKVQIKIEDSKNIFVKLLAENPSVTVKTSLGKPYEWLAGNLAPAAIAPGQTIDFTVDISDAVPAAIAMQAITAASQVRSLDRIIEVFWPSNPIACLPGQNGNYGRATRTIDLCPSFVSGTSDLAGMIDVVVHEYGHALHCESSAGCPKGDHNPENLFDRHPPTALPSETAALVGAWADFVAVVVRNEKLGFIKSFGATEPEVSGFDIERFTTDLGTNALPGSQRGTDVKASVIGTLWDLYDGQSGCNGQSSNHNNIELGRNRRSDPWKDMMCLSFNQLYEVFGQSEFASITDFGEALFSRYSQWGGSIRELFKVNSVPLENAKNTARYTLAKDILRVAFSYEPDQRRHIMTIKAMNNQSMDIRLNVYTLSGMKVLNLYTQGSEMVIDCGIDRNGWKLAQGVYIALISVSSQTQNMKGIFKVVIRQ